MVFLPGLTKDKLLPQFSTTFTLKDGEPMYTNERLDHLGIVAGVCQEIGLAAWLDAQDPTNRQQVSVGTATVAMILNGLGFSNRQLYLVPQYFANKPVEHLLGTGIKAEMR